MREASCNGLIWSSNLLASRLIYFYNNNYSRVYCGRHHAELLKPRCPACDEVIFSDECTEGEGRNLHMTLFACFDFNEILGGQRYFIKSSRPYCGKCFEKIHIELCATCGKSIGASTETNRTSVGQYWRSLFFLKKKLF